MQVTAFGRQTVPDRGVVNSKLKIFYKPRFSAFSCQNRRQYTYADQNKISFPSCPSPSLSSSSPFLLFLSPISIHLFSHSLLSIFFPHFPSRLFPSFSFPFLSLSFPLFPFSFPLLFFLTLSHPLPFFFLPFSFSIGGIDMLPVLQQLADVFVF